MAVRKFARARLRGECVHGSSVPTFAERLYAFGPDRLGEKGPLARAACDRERLVRRLLGDRQSVAVVIGHVFRQARFTGDRFWSAEDTARMRDLLATGDYPLLARLYADDPRLTPAPDTFEIGLEWLFDGLQAVLDARND